MLAPGDTWLRLMNLAEWILVLVSTLNKDACKNEGRVPHTPGLRVRV